MGSSELLGKLDKTPEGSLPCASISSRGSSKVTRSQFVPRADLTFFVKKKTPVSSFMLQRFTVPLKMKKALSE